jgi:hypothetical protein
MVVGTVFITPVFRMKPMWENGKADAINTVPTFGTEIPLKGAPVHGFTAHSACYTRRIHG